MPARLVVCFRGVVAADPDGGSRYLARALLIKKRAEALGATLCAWSAHTFSFDLSPEEIEEAISLAMLAREGEPANERCGVGLAQGELHIVGDGGSLAILSWGTPLVDAVVLARDARPGEVLVGPRLAQANRAVIEELGYKIQADTTRKVFALSAPALAPLPADLEVPTERRPTFPPMPPVEPARSTPPARGTTPPGATRGEVADLARRALVSGDVPTLEALALDLRESGEHEDLGDRVNSFLALRRGVTGDALRVLRAAAEAEQPAHQRARTRLAYGVALARAGRADAALLEVLDALARARETDDATGQHACARFLARLASASGHAEAAKVWAHVAAKTAAAE